MSLFARHHFPSGIFCMALLGALILFTFLKQSAYAGEGGWSNYTPGTYGDFSMNYAAPGLYFTESIFYFKGKLDDIPVLPTIYANGKQTTWFNLLSVSYVAQKKLLGGHYFVSANVASGLSSKLDLDVQGVGALDDNTTGLGDVWVAPFGLMWNLGSFHITLTEAFVLPAGRYNSNNLVNMGRNYTSFETDIGLTWLDEKNGHEVSFLAGYMINTKNQATDYATGDEFHIDFAIHQYFSENFAIGLVGYYYQQITDDSSPSLDAINQINGSLGLSTPDGYKGSAAGVGPAIMIGLSKDIKIVAKWIHEYHSTNRFSGDWAVVSLSMKF
jgi:hypothetical protein